ncbi:MAG: SMI1/KNR4 family protein [Pseudorhodobacter sp.]|nr:SMI1/KNR4 family protein [Pseudorhodobacter sp.]
MTRPDAMEHILARLDGEPGADPADIDRAALARPMPDALRRLYRKSADPMLNGVQLLPLDDYADVNAALPDGWVGFADDLSDGWFALTPDGKVVWLDRSDLRPVAARQIAGSLAAFLDLVLAGQTPWLDRDAAMSDRAALKALLDTPPPWIDTRPPRPDDQIEAARRQLHLPHVLLEILVRTDGLFIPATGARLFGLSDLAPELAVPSPWNGPAASHIGRTPDDRSALLMAADLPDHKADDVIAVATGQSWQTGRVLGPLPTVVLTWIKEGKP